MTVNTRLLSREENYGTMDPAIEETYESKARRTVADKRGRGALGNKTDELEG